MGFSLPACLRKDRAGSLRAASSGEVCTGSGQPLARHSSRNPPPGHSDGFVTATLGCAFPAQLLPAFPAGSAPRCRAHAAGNPSGTAARIPLLPHLQTRKGTWSIQVIPAWMSQSRGMGRLAARWCSRPGKGSNPCSSRTCKPQTTQISTQLSSASGISPAANIYGFAAVHTVRSHIPAPPAAAADGWIPLQAPLVPAVALQTPLWEQQVVPGTSILLEEPVGSLADPKLLQALQRQSPCPWRGPVIFHFPLLSPRFRESRGISPSWI